MRATVMTFHVPKAGSTEEEYEDAFSVSPELEGEVFVGSRLVAAVADGASEAMLAGRWARHLAATFTNSQPEQDLPATILAAADGWDAIEAEYRQLRDDAGDPIAWYEEDGLQSGSYATLVGVHLLDPDSGSGAEGPLVAQALGDACFFQVREEKLLTSFPICDSTAFDTSPSLAPSKRADLNLIGQHVQDIQTTWQQGDRLYLTSDALAHWFLSQTEVSGRPWDRLSEYGTEAATGDFAALVEGCRSNGSLKNDDTTLVRIDIQCI